MSRSGCDDAEPPTDGEEAGPARSRPERDEPDGSGRPDHQNEDDEDDDVGDDVGDALLSGGLRALFDDLTATGAAAAAAMPMSSRTPFAPVSIPGTVASSSAPDTAGDGGEERRVGRYRILGEIARGGVGVVLKGLDGDLGREVAIKLLLDGHARNPAMARRLIEEAQIGGQLQHPGIVPVHELGLLGGGRPFLTMKLVKGRTLASHLAEREDLVESRPYFLGIFEKICQAIAYAHARGVLHRDLKPHNVMIGAFGEVQVMDWGLAKVRFPSDPESQPPSPVSAQDCITVIQTLRSDGTHRSMTGSVMGTPAYMSPEQARGEVELLDERADVFSLGAILCEILIGDPPYEGTTSKEVLSSARRARMDRAQTRLDACDADSALVDLARRCLSPVVEDRPNDASYVAAAVSEYLASLESRAREAALEAAEARVRVEGERKARRLTLMIASLALITVIVGGGAVLFIGQERRRRTEAAEIMVERSVAEARDQAHEAERTEGVAAFARWEAALDAMARAKSLLAPEMDASLHASTIRIGNDLLQRERLARGLHRLEAIRQEVMDYSERQAQDDAYTAAFETLLAGADLRALPEDEAVARLGALDAPVDLALALDDWSEIRRTVEGVDWRRPTSVARTLMRIAARLDPDPWRRSFREAFGEQRFDDLEAMADDLDGVTSPVSFSVLAVALQFSNRTEKAEEVLRVAQNRFPGDFWIHYMLGDLARRNEDGRPIPERFLSDIKVAIALRPASPYPYMGLAVYHNRRHEQKAALAAAERGLSLAPDNVYLLNIKGMILRYDRARTTEAEEAFRRAYDASGSLSVLSNLAELMILQGRMDEAGRLTTRLLEERPDLGKAHYLRALVLWAEGHRKDALAEFRETARLTPDQPYFRTMLGHYLNAAGRYEEAISALRESIELEPSDEIAWSTLGTANLGAGRYDDAVEAYTRSIRIDPEAGYPYSWLMTLLGRPDAEVDADTMAELIGHLDRLLHSGGPHHAAAPQVLINAWCRRPESLVRSRILEIARTEVVRTSGDPAASRSLARVLAQVGDVRAAIRTLEDAQALRPGLDPFPELPAYRARVAPELVSYASIDDAVSVAEDLPDSLEAALERFRPSLDAATGEDAERRAIYMKGRILQRLGRHIEARECLEAVLRFDHDRPEPFISLWQSLLATGAPEEAREVFRTVSAGGLPDGLLPIPPVPPRCERVEDDPLSVGPQVWSVTELLHPDPRVTLVATEWQLWRDGDDPERSLLSGGLVKGPGLAWAPPILECLEPGGSVRCRARQLASNGFISPFGPAEATTVRGSAPPRPRPIPIDLSACFTHDVIADPGDTENDAFDGSGNRLIVEGFDGIRVDDPTMQGVPADRRIGVHRLGDYQDRNAVRMTSFDRAEIRVAIPAGRYAALRCLVAGSHGDSTVPVTVRYADGSTDDRRIAGEDWFNDVDLMSPSKVDSDCVPVWNGMDRLGRDGPEDCNDPALFEVRIAVDPTREVVALDLHGERATFESDSARFHLFALTAMPAGR